MKTLLALLVLALVLAGGYWKIQNPDGGIDELQQQAGATVQRFHRGIDTVIDGKAADGGAATEQEDPGALDALESRLAALEADAAAASSNAAAGNTDETTTAAQSGDTDRVGELEASLSKVRRDVEASVAGNETAMAELDALSATVTALESRVNGLAENQTDSQSSAQASGDLDGQGTNRQTDSADDSAAGQTAAAALEERFSRLDKRIASLAASVDSASERATGSASEATSDSISDAASESTSDPAPNDQASAPTSDTASESTSEAASESAASATSDPASGSASDSSPDRTADSSAETPPAPPTIDQAATPGDDEPPTGEIAEVVDDELRAEEAGRSIEYKIYFELGSTDITDEAAQVLDSFIVQEKNRTIGVSIFGLTDPQGPAEFNRLVADERARNVQSYLVENGLDGALVTAVSGLGEVAAANVLDDNVSAAQQRAVVLFAAQP